MNARLFFATMMLLLGCLFSGQSSAQGISDKLNNALDSMSNYTPPGVYNGSRRTIITGGSLTLKMQSGSTSGFGFKPPSVSAGCGGIDAFFGSFSMISKEQLVQALRGIVTGAIVYAFKLAISVICEKCATWMADIGALLAEANNWLIDSCNISYNALVSASGSPESVAAKWKGQNLNTSMGGTDDANSSKKQGSTVSSWTAAMQTARTGSGSGAVSGAAEPNKTILTDNNAEFGNHMWRVMKRAGQASFTIGGTDAFAEEMMSMVGTVIVCGSKDDGCSASAAGEDKKQQGELTSRPIKYSVTLNELVSGPKGGRPISFWRCNDKNETGCLNPAITDDPSYIPLEKRFKDAFLGKSGSPGIIYKLRYSPTTAPTAEEEFWLKSGGTFVGQIFKIARLDEHAARSFANDWAEVIVSQMAVEFMRDSFSKLRVSASREQLNGMQSLDKMMEEAEKRTNEDYEKFMTESSGKNGQIQAYLARLSSMRQ